MKQAKSESMRRFERRLVMLSGIMILLSLFLLGRTTGTFTGQLLAQEVSEEEQEQFYEFSDLFAEAYQNVKDRYVEEVDDRELFENAIQGMFNALDPHSTYLDPDNYAQLEKETEGEFSGIGIHLALYPKDPNALLTEDNRVLTVVAPMPGSPAADAGVQSWDHIVKIEGESTEGMTLADAVRRLTGPEGSQVTFSVERPGEEELLQFTVTRRQIKIESIYWKMLDDDILLVRIARFSDNTTQDLRHAVEEGISQGARGIIVDLRWDTGGLLSEAIDASDLFLDRGDVIVSTKGRSRGQNREYRARSRAMVDWPMLILINRATASASEIFSGAMRDHDRALLIGPKGGRTYGKGSVQTIDELDHSLERDDDGNYRRNAIRLTTARYYTPNGTAIDNPKEPEKAGLAPDIEVEITPEHELELSRSGILLGEPNMIDPNGSRPQDDPLIEDLSPEDEAKLLAEIKRIAGIDSPRVTITIESQEKPAIHYAIGDEDEVQITDLQLGFAVDYMKKILAGEVPMRPSESSIAQAEEAPAAAALP